MSKYELVISDKVINVTSQDIDDIMVSALEDGIVYWCEKVKVEGEYLGEYASDQISHGGSLMLYDIEDGYIYTLDLQSFLKGLTMFIQEYNTEYDIEYVNLADGSIGIDTGYIDSECADIIIQLALFNEVIFG